MPTAPGEEHDLIPLKPKSHLFEEGHRIRVAIAAAYFPETMPVGEQGSFTVRSTPADPTVVRLPGTDRPGDYDDRAHMNAPSQSMPRQSEYITDTATTWETTRERTDGTAVARMETETELDLPHAQFTETGEFEARVTADDPGSLVAHNSVRFDVEYPHESVAVIASNRITRDLVQLTTRVEVDGDTYFERHWTD